jgi:hypothetical protein
MKFKFPFFSSLDDVKETEQQRKNAELNSLMAREEKKPKLEDKVSDFKKYVNNLSNLDALPNLEAKIFCARIIISKAQDLHEERSTVLQNYVKHTGAFPNEFNEVIWKKAWGTDGSLDKNLEELSHKIDQWENELHSRNFQLRGIQA